MDYRYTMTFDPSKFLLINVVDTCAVWNILSSRLLFQMAIQAQCKFCITSFVQYECLVKRRRNPNSNNDIELIGRLKKEQRRGHFSPFSCEIEDLQSISLLENRKRLGKGELSSIAFSNKIRQSFITDDNKAKKLAESVGVSSVQTTPHLLGWRIYSGVGPQQVSPD